MISSLLTKYKHMLFTDTKYYDNVYFHILTQLNIICDHVSSHIVSLKSIIQQYLLESIDSYYANCEQVHAYQKWLLDNIYTIFKRI